MGFTKHFEDCCLSATRGIQTLAQTNPSLVCSPFASERFILQFVRLHLTSARQSTSTPTLLPSLLSVYFSCVTVAARRVFENKHTPTPKQKKNWRRPHSPVLRGTSCDEVVGLVGQVWEQGEAKKFCDWLLLSKGTESGLLGGQYFFFFS